VRRIPRPGLAGGAKRALGAALLLAVPAFAACAWDPSRPFDRDAPQVKEAVAQLADGGDAGAATSLLEGYLTTGPCQDGIIGTPDGVTRRPDGTFDLGLALFQIGEQYGKRFGDEESAEAKNSGVTEAVRSKRHAQVECARRLVQAIANDDGVPGDLRARAHYLSGNLAFLDGDYQDAVDAYDRALVLAPGEPDSGDPVGRDAAYNRAIALRRIEDNKKDASPPDGGGDGSTPPQDGGQSGHDGGQPPPDAGNNGNDGGGRGGPDGGPDAGHDAEAPPPPEPDAGPEAPPDAGPMPATNRDEDQRMLDQLENAPTLQQEEAKRFGKKRVRGMADK
jgi:tetratricopeptide (TPR) repeat protein